jgi:hypothetical protein
MLELQQPVSAINKFEHLTGGEAGIRTRGEV